MKIIFTMAGLSSRFAKAGYKEPKFKLKLGKNSVFFHAVDGFKKYFDDYGFVFIYLDREDTGEFLRQECQKLGIKECKFIGLKEPTLGQAHTAYLGIKALNLADDEGILIFNIDTFRPNFTLPEFDLNSIDGYLEVFKAKGEQYSFALAQPNTNKVIKTAEKERISELCSTGLYYFRRAKDFKESFESLENKGLKSKNEYYIAPMYNELIKAGKDIRYEEISAKEVIFCGVPQEYEVLKKGF